MDCLIRKSRQHEASNLHLRLCHLLPAVDAPLLRVEVHADHPDGQPAGLELLIVVAVHNLADGFLGVLVQLELEDIDRL